MNKVNSINFEKSDIELWRHLSHKSLRYLQTHGAIEICDGVKSLGLDSGDLPSLDDLNSKLSKFGWSVTPVDGFVSSKIFLECLSRQCLPISIKMRSWDEVEFSAAPDYFHEAFGHVSMLGNSDIRTFLRRYGEIGLKCFSFENDDEYLQNLSENILFRKNQPQITLPIIVNLPENEVSELIQLTRIGWWTFETGLILQEGKFKAWGAALLSSQSELLRFGNMPIFPFSLDCVWKHFDPSTYQLEYHYIESFSEAKSILEKFEKTLAVNAGGYKACHMALNSKSNCRIRSRQKNLVIGRIVELNRKTVLVKLDELNNINSTVQLNVEDIYSIERLEKI